MTPIDIDPAWLSQLLTAVGVLITAIVGIINVAWSKRINYKIDATTIELKEMSMDRALAASAKRRPPSSSHR